MGQIKLKLILGQSILLLGLILSSFNIFSGFELSNREITSSENHFLRAVITLAALVISQLLLLHVSQKICEHLETGDIQKMDLAKARRQQAFPSALTCILLCLTSFITGTVAHPGKFPFLHGILGFALVGISILTFVYWARFSSAVRHEI